MLLFDSKMPNAFWNLCSFIEHWSTFEISDLSCDKTNELVTHFKNDVVYNLAHFSLFGRKGNWRDLGRYSYGPTAAYVLEKGFWRT